MDRIYINLLKKHFASYNQMAFMSGPRQVGKTTIAKKMQESFKESIYLNWDVVQDRERILQGQHFIEDIFPSHVLRDNKPLIIFDEIHKYKNWKNFLKGFFDLYKDLHHILVTGSAHLSIYQSGNDSLMGRYFSYTVFPLTLAEVLCADRANTSFFLDCQAEPSDLSATMENLFQFGGFADPYLKHDQAFLNLWHSTRSKQLIFEDIQTLTQIHDVYLIDVLSELLKRQTGQLLNRSSLGKKIKTTTQTVSRWMETLERFYYCFSVFPWHQNVARSLIKEPKVYLWDWSLVEDGGARFENMVAVHLQKFVHFYREQGLEKLDLYYLRDIDQREVDFIVTKNHKPYMLIEVKLSERNVNPHIFHFQKQLKATYVMQVVYNMEPTMQSCFRDDYQAYVVPAQTALSQLV